MTHFPDWRIASAYPNEYSYKEAEELVGDPLFTSKAWAWQFLRRNPEYQTAFDNKRSQSNKRFTEQIAQRFGLLYLIPYTVEAPPAIPFANTFALRSLEHEIHRRKQPKLECFHLPLVFDLRLPIEHQLALAKIQIEEKIQQLNRHSEVPLTKKRSRKRARAYVRFLRIIDARASGASFEMISEQFASEALYHPSETNGYSCASQAEQDFYRAQDIVKRRYLEIAYS